MISGNRANPITEDDYRWLVSGIRYLFEVDADTPLRRSHLVALRDNVSRRVRDALGRQPAAQRAKTRP